MDNYDDMPDLIEVPTEPEYIDIAADIDFSSHSFHRKQNPHTDLVKFYLESIKTCDVHKIFGFLIDVAENIEYGVYKIESGVSKIEYAVEHLIEKIGIVPNIWKSYKKFCNGSMTPPYWLKWLVVKIYILVKSLNNWMINRTDFATDSAEEFYKICKPIALASKCKYAGILWNNLNIGSEIDIFIKNSTNILGSVYQCACRADNWNFAFDSPYNFPVQKADLADKIMLGTKPTYWRDCLNQIHLELMEKLSELKYIKAESTLINLYSLPEPVITKILFYFWETGREKIFMESNYTAYENLSFWIGLNENVPTIYEICYPTRCFLCDSYDNSTFTKLDITKGTIKIICKENKISKDQIYCTICKNTMISGCNFKSQIYYEKIPDKNPFGSEHMNIYDYIPPAITHLPFGPKWYGQTDFVYKTCQHQIINPSTNIMAPLPDNNMSKYLRKFRHYKFVLICCAINDEKSIFYLCPKDLLKFIIEFISRYRRVY